MTKDICVEQLIKCAEIHNEHNAGCGGCDYKDYDDCVDVMLADAITIIKAGYREACKVENRPIEEGRGEKTSFNSDATTSYVKVNFPFEGCKDCDLMSLDRKSKMLTSPIGEAYFEHAWVCTNENKCKYIVRKAVGDDEFDRLISEGTK